LEGREPVVFPISGDRVVASMEVTRLLRTFPLVQYQLHQDADGGFRFGYRGGADADELRMALFDLLGKPQLLVIEKLDSTAPAKRKFPMYHSDRPLRPHATH
jgi:hypothetical protein